MNADSTVAQRIGALTPLNDLLALVERIAPVPAQMLDVAQAQGRVLAADAVAPRRRPERPLALVDGWAVASESIRDAGPYAPVPLQPQRVEAFAPLPENTDAVAPLDAVVAQGGGLQAVMPAAPGEGVLEAGHDVEAGATIARAGTRLTALDVALMSLAGVAKVSLRAPVIAVVQSRPQDRALDAIATYIDAALMACGASAERSEDLDAALRDARADAVIGIGGTGSGRNDRAVIALQRAGEVARHGIALSPGETTAFGQVGSRPVLLLPGRLDGALAGWLAIGRSLVARLCDAALQDRSFAARLSRKLASPIGMASVVPVERDSSTTVVPLGGGFLSVQQLARAHGWILVPGESEGWPAGTEIRVHPL